MPRTAVQNLVVVDQISTSIQGVALHPDLLYWVERLEALDGEFAAIFEHRTRYLWRWVQLAFETTSLQRNAEQAQSILSLKCRFGFIAILLDDLCDIGKDEQALQTAVGILQGKPPSVKTDPYYHLLNQVWDSVQRDLQYAPNYDQLTEELNAALATFGYSFKFCLSAMSRLLNGENIWPEYIHFVPHTTSIYLAGFVELLYAPVENLANLSDIKRLLANTQTMGQIGNWITTVQREFDQEDLSSGLVVLAVENGWLEPAELRPPVDYMSVADRIEQSSAEAELQALWDKLQAASCEIAQRCDRSLGSPLWINYVESFSTILRMQKESVGLT